MYPLTARNATAARPPAICSAAMRTLPFLALLFAGCGPDAETRAAAEYGEQLQPLLFENSLLAERVLTLAAGQYNGGVPGEDLAKKWEEQIAQLAAHLHDQASFV